MNRWAPFALSLAASVALSALLFALGIPLFFLFLLGVPLLFIPPRATEPPRRCPGCRMNVDGAHWRFCPACGHAL
jgi:hypothetical protein